MLGLLWTEKLVLCSCLSTFLGTTPHFQAWKVLTCVHCLFYQLSPCSLLVALSYYSLPSLSHASPSPQPPLVLGSSNPFCWKIISVFPLGPSYSYTCLLSLLLFSALMWWRLVSPSSVLVFLEARRWALSARRIRLKARHGGKARVSSLVCGWVNLIVTAILKQTSLSAD